MEKWAIEQERLFVKSIANNVSIEVIENQLETIFQLLQITEYKISWIDNHKEISWINKQLVFQFETQRQLISFGNSNIAILYFNSTSHLQDFENIIKAIIIHCYFVIFKKSKLDGQLMKKDLEVAARMQKSLIPTDLFSNNFFQASGLYMPNYEVGGDFYDVIPINDYKIGFCIGDISGKGINAAIIMSHFIGFIRSILIKNIPLEETIALINKKMYELVGGEKYITLFLGIYNSEDKRLVYINSGHLPIPIYDENEMEWLDKGTTILGMFPELPFIELGKKFISSQQKLLLYTDGLLNLNIDHEPFLSKGELAYILNKDCIKKSPAEITAYFRENIKTIDVDDDIKDDISILAVELS